MKNISLATRPMRRRNWGEHLAAVIILLALLRLGYIRGPSI